MNGETYTILDEESGYTLAPCNECGRLIPAEDELCGECYREQLLDEFEEALHPEWRCPPRE